MTLGKAAAEQGRTIATLGIPISNQVDSHAWAAALQQGRCHGHVVSLSLPNFL
jgi:hypothetical protein